MKLKEFNKCGYFYEDTKDTLYEVYENCDYIENFDELSTEEQDRLYEEKIRPDSKFLVDVWYFDVKDAEGLRHYDCDGLIYTFADYGDLEVQEDNTKYVRPETGLNSGCFMHEDKLTYREQLQKILELCDKASTKSIYCNGVENKDMQKLAIKIMKIIDVGNDED